LNFLPGKITEREQRIAKLRAEFEISDAEMVDLLSQFTSELSNNYPTSRSYSTRGRNNQNPKIIGAGVIQNLLAERAQIDAEKESMSKMQRIVRNLRPSGSSRCSPCRMPNWNI